jgi:hypothetical protein
LNHAPPRNSFPFGEALKRLARDWRFWLLPLNNSGTLIYLWGLNSWLPTYLQQARHFTIAMTGFYSALPFAFVIAGQIFFSWLGDKTGKRAAVVGGTLFMTGVFCYLAAVAPDADVAAWCIAISAGFWGGATPPLFALSMQIIPREVSATGFGILAGISNIVGSSAPFIMGLLLSLTGSFTAGLEFLCSPAWSARSPCCRSCGRIDGLPRFAPIHGSIGRTRPAAHHRRTYLQRHRARAARSLAIPRSSRGPTQSLLVPRCHGRARPQLRWLCCLRCARQLARDIRRCSRRFGR